jgi:hypothetical protein
MTNRTLLVLFAALCLGPALRAQQRPARPQTPPAPAAQRRDTARARSDTVPRVEYWREVYSYGGGPRDPFQPLIMTGEVGPEIDELRLVAVAYDPRYGNSVAIIRQEGNPRAHRLRRGDPLGRLRVIEIRQYEVVFQIEEFGFERQEVLSLSRPTEANR